MTFSGMNLRVEHAEALNMTIELMTTLINVLQH